MKLRLTEQFWLHEFTFSEVAARMGREIEPTTEQLENVGRLCRTLLQPIRDQLGRQMVITSGIRPDWLNKAIGGAPNSDHLYGLAADVLVVGMSPVTFARWVEHRDFPLKQCICEFGRWVHLSIPRSGKPANEYLTASMLNGRTVYTVGV